MQQGLAYALEYRFPIYATLGFTSPNSVTKSRGAYNRLIQDGSTDYAIYCNGEDMKDEGFCKDCAYCRPCKKLVNKEWQWFNICTLFADDANGWCLVVADGDNCEEFTPKEQT